MNRGILGIARGKGRGMGLQHIYLGSGVPGNSTQALGAGAVKQLARKVVPPRSGFLASIDCYCFAPSGGVQALGAGVLQHDDSLGSLPTAAKMISWRGAERTDSNIVVAANLNTVPRWLSMHIGTYLKGGVPYWLIFNGGNGLTVYYNDDTGSDAEAAANATWGLESGVGYSLSAKRWSIRGSFVY